MLYNESETLRCLARCRAHKMSREEALNWLGVTYELLKRYSTLVQELERPNEFCRATDREVLEGV